MFCPQVTRVAMQDTAVSYECWLEVCEHSHTFQTDHTLQTDFVKE